MLQDKYFLPKHFTGKKLNNIFIRKTFYLYRNSKYFNYNY